jgi:hypothetical protein
LEQGVIWMSSSLEKENLVRILRNEKPIQNWLCRLSLHRWTRWTYEPRWMNPVTFEMEGRGVQYCECEHCGFTRMEAPYSKTLFKKDKK